MKNNLGIIKQKVCVLRLKDSQERTIVLIIEYHEMRGTNVR